MKRFSGIFLVLVLLSGLTGISFSREEETLQPGRKSIGLDTFIDAFFTNRTGDLPEMLNRHQIRVLVVPSRSAYFLDKAGQPRGLDYQLLKGYVKILNRKRKKGDTPTSVIFIPVTREEQCDALFDGRGDIAGLTLITPRRSAEASFSPFILQNSGGRKVTLRPKGDAIFSSVARVGLPEPFSN